MPKITRGGGPTVAGAYPGAAPPRPPVGVPAASQEDPGPSVPAAPEEAPETLLASNLYDDWYKADLALELGRRGLSRSGTKAEMTARLKEGN